MSAAASSGAFAFPPQPGDEDSPRSPRTSCLMDYESFSLEAIHSEVKSGLESSPFVELALTNSVHLVCAGDIQVPGLTEDTDADEDWLLGKPNNEDFTEKIVKKLSQRQGSWQCLSKEWYAKTEEEINKFKQSTDQVHLGITSQAAIPGVPPLSFGFLLCRVMGSDDDAMPVRGRIPRGDRHFLSVLIFFFDFYTATTGSKGAGAVAPRSMEITTEADYLYASHVKFDVLFGVKLAPVIRNTTVMKIFRPGVRTDAPIHEIMECIRNGRGSLMKSMKSLYKQLFTSSVIVDESIADLFVAAAICLWVPDEHAHRIIQELTKLLKYDAADHLGKAFSPNGLLKQRFATSTKFEVLGMELYECAVRSVVELINKVPIRPQQAPVISPRDSKTFTLLEVPSCGPVGFACQSPNTSPLVYPTEPNNMSISASVNEAIRLSTAEQVMQWRFKEHLNWAGRPHFNLEPDDENFLHNLFQKCDIDRDDRLNVRILLNTVDIDPVVASFFKLSRDDDKEEFFKELIQQGEDDATWEDFRDWYVGHCTPQHPELNSEHQPWEELQAKVFEQAVEQNVRTASNGGFPDLDRWSRMLKKGKEDTLKEEKKYARLMTDCKNEWQKLATGSSNETWTKYCREKASLSSPADDDGQVYMGSDLVRAMVTSCDRHLCLKVAYSPRRCSVPLFVQLLMLDMPVVVHIWQLMFPSRLPFAQAPRQQLLEARLKEFADFVCPPGSSSVCMSKEALTIWNRFLNSQQPPAPRNLPTPPSVQARANRQTEPMPSRNAAEHRPERSHSPDEDRFQTHNIGAEVGRRRSAAEARGRPARPTEAEPHMTDPSQSPAGSRRSSVSGGTLPAPPRVVHQNSAPTFVDRVATSRVARWICPACDEPNSESRMQCNNCGGPRPSAAEQESPFFAPHSRPSPAANLSATPSPNSSGDEEIAGRQANAFDSFGRPLPTGQDIPEHGGHHARNFSFDPEANTADVHTRTTLPVPTEPPAARGPPRMSTRQAGGSNGSNGSEASAGDLDARTMADAVEQPAPSMPRRQTGGSNVAETIAALGRTQTMPDAAESFAPRMTTAPRMARGGQTGGSDAPLPRTSNDYLPTLLGNMMKDSREKHDDDYELMEEVSRRSRAYPGSLPARRRASGEEAFVSEAQVESNVDADGMCWARKAAFEIPRNLLGILDPWGGCHVASLQEIDGDLRHYEDGFPQEDLSIVSEGEMHGIQKLSASKYPHLMSGASANMQVRLCERVHPRSMIQGHVGDCWLISAVAALCEFEQPIRDVFAKCNAIHSDATGPYELLLHDPKSNFARVSKYINDEIPCFRQRVGWRPCFASTLSEDGKSVDVWPMLLEKGIASLLGGYLKLNGNRAPLAWAIITGPQCFRTYFPWGEGDDAWGEGEFTDLVNKPSQYAYKPKGPENMLQSERIWGALRLLDIDGKLMACTFKSREGYSPDASHPRETDAGQGLLAGHAYSLITVKELRGTHRLLQLRNPWADAHEWSGPWSDKSREWQLYPEVADELKYGANNRKADGLFWMSWEDFKLRVCDIVYSETSFARKYGDRVTAAPPVVETLWSKPPLSEIQSAGMPAGLPDIWHNLQDCDPEKLQEDLTSYFDDFSDRAFPVQRQMFGSSDIQWVSASRVHKLIQYEYQDMLEDLPEEDRADCRRWAEIAEQSGASDSEDAKLCSRIDLHVMQARSGNSWLVTAVSTLARYHKPITDIFASPKSLHKGKDGPYHLSLHDPNQGWRKRIVKLNDRVPCYAHYGNNRKRAAGWRPCYAAALYREVWPMLLEKAIAYLLNGYDKLDGNRAQVAWAILTGDLRYILYFPWQDDATQWGEGACDLASRTRQYKYQPKDLNCHAADWAWDKIKHAAKDGKLMACIFRSFDDAEPDAEIAEAGYKDGLAANHTYAIIAAESIQEESSSTIRGRRGRGSVSRAPDRSVEHRFLCLKSPWVGDMGWCGRWSFDSPEWEKHPKVAEQLNRAVSDLGVMEDGIFWMDWSQFQEYVQEVVVSEKAYWRTAPPPPPPSPPPKVEFAEDVSRKEKDVPKFMPDSEGPQQADLVAPPDSAPDERQRRDVPPHAARKRDVVEQPGGFVHISNSQKIINEVEQEEPVKYTQELRHTQERHVSFVESAPDELQANQWGRPEEEDREQGLRTPSAPMRHIAEQPGHASVRAFPPEDEELKNWGEPAIAPIRRIVEQPGHARDALPEREFADQFGNRAREQLRREEPQFPRREDGIAPPRLPHLGGTGHGSDLRRLGRADPMEFAEVPHPEPLRPIPPVPPLKMPPPSNFDSPFDQRLPSGAPGNDVLRMGANHAESLPTNFGFPQSCPAPVTLASPPNDVNVAFDPRRMPTGKGSQPFEPLTEVEFWTTEGPGGPRWIPAVVLHFSPFTGLYTLDVKEDVAPNLLRPLNSGADHLAPPRPAPFDVPQAHYAAAPPAPFDMPQAPTFHQPPAPPPVLPPAPEPNPMHAWTCGMTNGNQAMPRSAQLPPPPQANEQHEPFSFKPEHEPFSFKPEPQPPQSPRPDAAQVAAMVQEGVKRELDEQMAQMRNSLLQQFTQQREQNDGANAGVHQPNAPRPPGPPPPPAPKQPPADLPRACRKPSMIVEPPESERADSDTENEKTNDESEGFVLATGQRVRFMGKRGPWRSTDGRYTLKAGETGTVHQWPSVSYPGYVEVNWDAAGERPIIRGVVREDDVRPFKQDQQDVHVEVVHGGGDNESESEYEVVEGAVANGAQNVAGGNANGHGGHGNGTPANANAKNTDNKSGDHKLCGHLDVVDHGNLFQTGEENFKNKCAKAISDYLKIYKDNVLITDVRDLRNTVLLEQMPAIQHAGTHGKTVKFEIPGSVIKLNNAQITTLPTRTLREFQRSLSLLTESTKVGNTLPQFSQHVTFLNAPSLCTSLFPTNTTPVMGTTLSGMVSSSHVYAHRFITIGPIGGRKPNDAQIRERLMDECDAVSHIYSGVKAQLRSHKEVTRVGAGENSKHFKMEIEVMKCRNAMTRPEVKKIIHALEQRYYRVDSAIHHEDEQRRGTGHRDFLCAHVDVRTDGAVDGMQGDMLSAFECALKRLAVDLGIVPNDLDANGDFRYADAVIVNAYDQNHKGTEEKRVNTTDMRGARKKMREHLESRQQQVWTIDFTISFDNSNGGLGRDHSYSHTHGMAALHELLWNMRKKETKDWGKKLSATPLDHQAAHFWKNYTLKSGVRLCANKFSTNSIAAQAGPQCTFISVLDFVDRKGFFEKRGPLAFASLLSDALHFITGIPAPRVTVLDCKEVKKDAVPMADGHKRYAVHVEVGFNEAKPSPLKMQRVYDCMWHLHSEITSNRWWHLPFFRNYIVEGGVQVDVPRDDYVQKYIQILDPSKALQSVPKLRAHVDLVHRREEGWQGPMRDLAREFVDLLENWLEIPQECINLVCIRRRPSHLGRATLVERITREITHWHEYEANKSNTATQDPFGGDETQMYNAYVTDPDNCGIGWCGYTFEFEVMPPATSANNMWHRETELDKFRDRLRKLHSAAIERKYVNGVTPRILHDFHFDVGVQIDFAAVFEDLESNVEEFMYPLEGPSATILHPSCKSHSGDALGDPYALKDDQVIVRAHVNLRRIPPAHGGVDPGAPFCEEDIRDWFTSALHANLRRHQVPAGEKEEGKIQVVDVRKNMAHTSCLQQFYLKTGATGHDQVQLEGSSLGYTIAFEYRYKKRSIPTRTTSTDDEYEDFKKMQFKVLFALRNWIYGDVSLQRIDFDLFDRRFTFDQGVMIDSAEHKGETSQTMAPVEIPASFNIYSMSNGNQKKLEERFPHIVAEAIGTCSSQIVGVKLQEMPAKSNLTVHFKVKTLTPNPAKREFESLRTKLNAMNLQCHTGGRWWFDLFGNWRPGSVSISQTRASTYVDDKDVDDQLVDSDQEHEAFNHIDDFWTPSSS